MYWCWKCEINSENKKCEMCGGETSRDKGYHKHCN